jgi:hypothetical protein
MLDKFINLIPPHVRNNIRDHIVDTLAEASSDNRWRKLINSFRSDAEFRDAFDAALGRALQRFTTEYSDKALVEALTHTRVLPWDMVDKSISHLSTSCRLVFVSSQSGQTTLSWSEAPFECFC